jgi:hypothetical protein
MPRSSGADPIVAYFQTYLSECWKARQYYKDEQNKLLYWGGTVFVSVVAATGIFGAFKTEGQQVSFGLTHVFVFHGVFVVAWLFYKYKQLSADTYEELGGAVEDFLRRRYGPSSLTQIPSFFRVKEIYVGKKLTAGRGISAAANLLLILVYLVLVTVPIVRGSFVDGGFAINWAPLIALAVFAGVVALTEYWYRCRKRQILGRIRDEWPTYAARELAALERADETVGGEQPEQRPDGNSHPAQTHQ